MNTLIAAMAYLFPHPIWFVAFVAIALNGLLGALALVYRRRVGRLQYRNEQLGAQLVGSLQWNEELTAARNDVDQLVQGDPMHVASQLPQRDDPLEQAFALPPYVRDHERGQQ